MAEVFAEKTTKLFNDISEVVANFLQHEIKNNDDATNVAFNVAAHFLAWCLMGIESEARLFILAKVTQHVIGIITTDDNILFNGVTH